jgi:hypothetical protein
MYNPCPSARRLSQADEQGARTRAAPTRRRPGRVPRGINCRPSRVGFVFWRGAACFGMEVKPTPVTQQTQSAGCAGSVCFPLRGDILAAKSQGQRHQQRPPPSRNIDGSTDNGHPPSPQPSGRATALFPWPCAGPSCLARLLCAFAHTDTYVVQRGPGGP